MLGEGNHPVVIGLGGRLPILMLGFRMQRQYVGSDVTGTLLPQSVVTIRQ